MRACVLCQAPEEVVALGRVGRLVGDAPNDDVGAVVVAADHIGQLLFGVGEGGGVLPGDGPIDGDL